MIKNRSGTPHKKIKWLGFELDSAANKFIIPEEKVLRTRNAAIKNLAHSQYCSAREIAKTVGQICSYYHALSGSVGQWYTSLPKMHPGGFLKE